MFIRTLKIKMIKKNLNILNPDRREEGDEFSTAAVLHRLRIYVQTSAIRLGRGKLDLLFHDETFSKILVKFDSYKWNNII